MITINRLAIDHCTQGKPVRLKNGKPIELETIKPLIDSIQIL